MNLKKITKELNAIAFLNSSNYEGESFLTENSYGYSATMCYSFTRPFHIFKGKIYAAKYYKLLSTMNKKGVMSYSEMKNFVSSDTGLQSVRYSDFIEKVGRGKYSLSIYGKEYILKIEEKIKKLGGREIWKKEIK